MGAADVRINPPSVQRYADQVQSVLDTIPRELDEMLSAVVGVNYSGTNAVQFKTECARMSVELSNSLRGDLSKIVDAVSEQIRSIADAFGDHVPQLTATGREVAMPAIPPGDGVLNADFSGLEALRTEIKSRMDQIGTLLDKQASDLRHTDWDGHAKDRAVDAVRRYTDSANSELATTGRNLERYIADQIAELKRRDGR